MRTMRVRQYAAEVCDFEAFDGNSARFDSGLQLWSRAAVWISPNNALMMAHWDENCRSGSLQAGLHHAWHTPRPCLHEAELFPSYFHCTWQQLETQDV